MTTQIQEKPKIKLMRLRCKFRPLHDAYFVQGKIVERDSDVEFLCQDGGVLKAHKIILASASKFFVELLEDQKCGKMTTINVPDIDTLTMQLILKLAYREKVSISMKRIRDVGDYLNLFGMEWKNFSFIESKAETKGDINLGGPDENFPVRNPNELKRYPGPRDNLVQASIAPNKRPRYETPPKEKQQTIKSPSPSSKKVAQQQIVDSITDNPESEKAIKSWINSLGKSDDQQDEVDQKPTSSNGIVQKKEQQTPPKYKQIVRNQEQRRASYYNDQTNICEICNYTCENEEKFKWHEDRHTGIMQFTCCFCPTVFDTERKIMAHEYNAHHFEPKFFTSQREQQLSSSSTSEKPTTNKIRNDNPIPKEKLILVRTAHGHHYRKPVNYAKLAKYNRSQHKQPNKGDNVTYRPKPPTLQKQVSATANNSSSTISSSIPKSSTSTPDNAARKLKIFKNKEIPLGEVEDSEEKEVISALKGIYWTYVCDKCKQESDSLQKAHEHYEKCCQDEIPEFVDSLHRYPLNYYGPIKCCRCFKRYALNSSFFLHCGHKHSELKKKFSVGNDDKILCGHCKGKFYDPQQFDEHLDEFENCPRGEDSLFNNELEVGEIVGENPFEVSRRQRLAKWNNSRPHLVKTAVARTGPRVVKRPKLNPDNEDNAAFSPGQCPICGERGFAKIVEHIKTEHREFDFNIIQVSNIAMKCKTCNTSFAICDLLTHSCEVNQRQKQPQQQDKPAASTQTKVVLKESQEEFVPVNGIGNSPIDVMECSDLLNINTIREAFNCQLCGKKGKKLGFGAECLKTHNIHRCSLCFNTYGNKEDYSQHLKVCHGSGTGQRLYCPCCPKTKDFANAGQVTAHMYSVHWLSFIRIIDQQQGRVSKVSGRIIDKKPTGRAAKNNDKNESNLDVTLGNIFDETRDVKDQDDEDAKNNDPEPEVENEKSEDKTQNVEKDAEVNADEDEDENGESEEGNCDQEQDLDESIQLTTDEDDTDVEGEEDQEDLEKQNESSSIKDQEISTSANQEKADDN